GSAEPRAANRIVSPRQPPAQPIFVAALRSSTIVFRYCSTIGFCYRTRCLACGKSSLSHKLEAYGLEFDELAPHHSITSSGVARSVGGMWRPSDFAVLPLITSWNFVGCSIGSSSGLAPRKILST